MATKVNEVKVRLIEQLGINEIGNINNRLKNCSPEQIRSQNVESLVDSMKGQMHTGLIGASNDMSQFQHSNIMLRNAGGAANFLTAQPNSKRDGSPL